jgi:hypothetical protein
VVGWRASFDPFRRGELGRIHDLLHGLLGTFVDKRPRRIVVGTQPVTIFDLTLSLDPIDLSQNAVLLTFRLTNHGSVSRVADVGVTANLFLDNLDSLVASIPDDAFTFLLWNPRS